MPFERISEIRTKQVTIWVDGKEIQAHEGESLHAAMCLAGITRLAPRNKIPHDHAVFCGMGVCFECLVTIDGQPDQRACMTQVKPGMKVETGRG